MRCFLTTLCAVLVLGSAAVVSAGPLERNAASKANGDMIGRAAPAQPVYRGYAPSTATRSFSYAPSQAPAASTPAPAPQAVPAPPVNRAPAARTRSYSYQPTAPRYYSAQPSVTPNYLRVDKKVLGY